MRLNFPYIIVNYLQFISLKTRQIMCRKHIIFPTSKNNFFSLLNFFCSLSAILSHVFTPNKIQIYKNWTTECRKSTAPARKLLPAGAIYTSYSTCNSPIFSIILCRDVGKTCFVRKWRGHDSLGPLQHCGGLHHPQGQPGLLPQFPSHGSPELRPHLPRPPGLF